MTETNHTPTLASLLTPLPKLFDNAGDEATYEFFKMLSEQVGIWSVYNFGNQLSHRPAMGIIEELQEFKEGYDEHNSEKMLDAAADIVIYMADYYSKRAWDLGVSWRTRHCPPGFDLPSAVSRLTKAIAHGHLKGEQNIRGGSEKHDLKLRETCAQILWYLEFTCDSLIGEDFINVIWKVWTGEVSKRDWKNKPNTAHVIQPQAIEGKVQYEVGDEVVDE